LCLEVASRLRREVDIPLVFMTYYNPVFSSGLESFCRASGQAGIDGLIIPDLPPEEGGELEDFGAREGIDIIYLLAPTSTPGRMNLVAERSRGFIYLVSLTGVTGAREALPPELEGFIARVRRRTTKSLCVGFGISTPEQAYRVAQVADGVIVGSRLIQLIDQSPFMGVRDFIRGLRLSLDQVERGSDR
jgi:tryptophan synthase alpha chain